MPVFLLPALAGALMTVCASLVGRVIMSLGMGLIAYTGISSGLAYFQTLFTGNMASAGATVAGMVGVLQLDTCMSIFTAAALARLAIAGASSGAVKRLAFK